MVIELQAFFLICGLALALWWLFWYFGRDGRLVRDWARSQGLRVTFLDYRRLGHCPFDGRAQPTTVIYIEGSHRGGGRIKGYVRLPRVRLWGAAGRLRFAPCEDHLRPLPPPPAEPPTEPSAGADRLS